MSRVCIYCQQRKAATEFSLEHIWPRALGGAQLGQLWKTKHVCQSCNTDAGQTIDGPFVRHPIVRNAKAYASWSEWQYLAQRQQAAPTSTVDLFFFGELDAIDIWGGPANARLWRDRTNKQLLSNTQSMNDAQAAVFARSCYQHFKRYTLYSDDPRMLAMSPLWREGNQAPEHLKHQPQQTANAALPEALLDALLDKVARGLRFQLFGTIEVECNSFEPRPLPAIAGHSWLAITQHASQLVLLGQLYGLLPFQRLLCSDISQSAIAPQFQPIIGQHHRL